MNSSEKERPLVGIVIGSKSDETMMQPALDMLKELSIPYEMLVMSAHRHPGKVRDYGINAQERGLAVIIAGAGKAAHLPGVLASWTILPVIGVPLPSGELKGIDALLSIAQMPSGIPVACVGIAAAKNAALLAAGILALNNVDVRKAYNKYRQNL